MGYHTKGNSTFGICSIYASNDCRERENMWEWISNLEDIPWVLGGDFNMVINPQDKQGGNKVEWKGTERIQWERMTNKLKLLDPLAGKKGEYKSIWYTWCNHQQYNKRVYCRLDRFYFNKDFFEINKNDGGIQYAFIPYTLSDHHPIMIGLKVMGNNISTVNPRLNFKMNASLLQDEDLKCAPCLVRLFNKYSNPQLSNIDRWNQNIKTWTSLFQAVGKKKAKDARASELQLQNDLQLVELDLQGDPENISLTNQLVRVKGDLRKLQNEKIKGWRTRAKLNWLDTRDRGSKFFFHILKMK